MEVELWEAASEAALRTMLTGAQSKVQLREQTHAELLQEGAARPVQAWASAMKK